jgi:hypothetical protein
VRGLAQTYETNKVTSRFEFDSTRRAGYPSTRKRRGGRRVPSGPRTLEPVLARPIRVEGDAEEDDVQKVLAPRRLLDRNFTVQ